MQTNIDAAGLCIAKSASLRGALALMDKKRLGIILVTDARGRLAGTITDGDLRRAILAKTSLDQPLDELLARKRGTRYARPVTAPAGTPGPALLALLQRHHIRHLPLIDSKRRVSGLVTMDDFVASQTLPLQAVVMAGGQGTRLLPLTENTPKPMLHVGDRPLMEIILEQLKGAGISQVKVTTHHKREKITDYFGDGKAFGLDLSYLYEDRPLGTAGALGLIRPPKETILVMNGDVLTQVNFRAMLEFHRDMKADLTAAVCQYDFKVPYGVVESDAALISKINEKPTLEFFVCAGIYLLEPSACRLIPKGRRFDMTDLIGLLIKKKRRVASFPIHEYWLDIGKPADFATAQRDVASWKK